MQEKAALCWRQYCGVIELKFLELAEKILSEVKRPLSPEEIWTLAVSAGYDKLLNSSGQTPVKTLSAQLYVQARDDKSRFIRIKDVRPTRFYFRNESFPSGSEFIGDDIIKPMAGPDFLERQLHPFLTYFAAFNWNASTKTIQHTKSKKKFFGEWMHPDMVGCQFPFFDYQTELADFASQANVSVIKLFSFELKRELSFDNLRESFFQAVSNSSWANAGYLVAANISADKDFRDELARLSKSFGIGVIELHLDDPDASEIIFTATEKEQLEWETMNRLASNNPDFAALLKRAKTDLLSREINQAGYDSLLDRDALIASIKPI